VSIRVEWYAIVRIGDYTPRTGAVGVTVATQLRAPFWVGVRFER